MGTRIRIAKKKQKSSPARLQDFFAAWFRDKGRILPWRTPDTTAFGMLVAEVLLRQTRAEMVAEVWPSLIREYPAARKLAAADPNRL